MKPSSISRSEEPWSLTVIRTHGLHYLRPEKSWRPIITLEVDKHHHHELTMGCDGQNPNLKSEFCIPEAHAASQVEIKVWHRAQSKKKGKKRNLVASACHSLGELTKKQGTDQTALVDLEVRLSCQSAKAQTRKNSASKGKPQSGAHLKLRVRPPPTYEAPITPAEPEAHEEDVFSDGDTKVLSDTLTEPASPCSDAYGSDQWPERPDDDKPVRPFMLDSDDECLYSPCDDEKKPWLSEPHPPYVVNPDDDPLAIKSPRDPNFNNAISSPIQWIFASMLPQYTEKIEVPSDMSRIELALATFTLYSELKTASLDSHFERVFHRLQMEWTYIGGLLVALAAVDTAVFAISSDSQFHMDDLARGAIAVSSIASGLGIACDAWFLLRYNWADLHTFIHRAKDVFGSYFFFSLSARVPSLCMLISSVSLLGFLGRVAYMVWPEGVTIACFLIGILMTLQFLVFGAHWCALKVAAGGRRVYRVVPWVGGKGEQ